MSTSITGDSSPFRAVVPRRELLRCAGALLLALLYSGWGNPAAGQGSGGGLSAPTTTQVLPPSPNAAALGHYGDVPVSLYTGLPSITVPLY